MYKTLGLKTESGRHIFCDCLLATLNMGVIADQMDIISPKRGNQVSRRSTTFNHYLTTRSRLILPVIIEVNDQVPMPITEPILINGVYLKPLGLIASEKEHSHQPVGIDRIKDHFLIKARSENTEKQLVEHLLQDIAHLNAGDFVWMNIQNIGTPTSVPYHNLAIKRIMEYLS